MRISYLIDLEQNVELKMNGSIKKYYESLGYTGIKNNNTFIVKAKELKNNSRANVVVKCDKCKKEYKIPYGNYTRICHNNENGLYFCKSCSTKRMNDKLISKEEQFNQFLEYCKKNNYVPLSTINDYENAQSILRYICPIHGERETNLNQVHSNHKCRLCGYLKSHNDNKLSKEMVIERVESKNNNKILNPDDYINIKTKNLRIICGSCGKEFISSLSSITNSEGHCPECGVKECTNASRLTPEYLDNLINLNGKKILLNPEDYRKNSVKNLKFVCEKCGKIFISSFTNWTYYRKTCKKCNNKESKGELAIAKILDKLNIQYEREYKFDDCVDQKILPFDFYLYYNGAMN